MKPMIIPSRKTVIGKIAAAKGACKSGNILLVTPDIIAADLINLGREVGEIPDILHELLENTDFRDYMGGRPPQRSYEPVILDCELYAFKTTSKTFGCMIYYKFTIKDDTLWLVSLHRDRS
jgi:hypothetical protein